RISRISSLMSFISSAVTYSVIWSEPVTRRHSSGSTWRCARPARARSSQRSCTTCARAPAASAVSGSSWTSVKRMPVCTVFHGGPGEVREHAVDAQPVELQVFLERVVVVVGEEPPLLVAERPRVDLQPARVRPLDEVGGRQRVPVGLVDGAVAVHVVGLPIVV